jgi:spectinomycin phosphotransferase
VIAEHPDIPAGRVGEVVRREWLVDINTVDHLEAGSTGWHWVLGDDDGPRWFATVDPVDTDDERSARIEAFEAAWQLAQQLPFAVAPVHTRAARIAVDIGAGLLLTLTPYLDGEPFGSGTLTDDAERVVVAALLGELHSQVRPRRLAVWRPRVGGRTDTGLTDLERCLDQDLWAGGPWSGPAARLVLDARPVVRAALRRYALLGAAVTGNIDRWVVTHGEPHTGNLLRTADGLRLVDWGAVALAPRERDLAQTLGEADGEEPWYAYMEAGGRPEPLSPDTLELFCLQRHLSVLCESAVRFSRPHQDTQDERRSFGHLERELGTLVDGWAQRPA